MALDNIPQKGQEFVNKVTDAIEKAGTEVADQVSHMTGNQPEEITEEAIHAAIDQALDVLQVAGDKVRQKELDAERVRLEVSIGISGIAHLSIKTDVPNEENVERREAEVS
ncbi:MAG: hypothetical protein F6J97_09290 [Leptolyngbya sp. SIO4C1]|nr:hypothetical protein [Leptolyngbya sp. SIO4C1]